MIRDSMYLLQTESQVNLRILKVQEVLILSCGKLLYKNNKRPLDIQVQCLLSPVIGLHACIQFCLHKSSGYISFSFFITFVF